MTKWAEAVEVAEAAREKFWEVDAESSRGKVRCRFDPATANDPEYYYKQAMSAALRAALPVLLGELVEKLRSEAEAISAAGDKLRRGEALAIAADRLSALIAASGEGV